MKYDFHVHTQCSDGKYSKLDLLYYFNINAYDVVSFADHNYIDENEEDELNLRYYERFGQEQRVLLINAIEFDVYENSAMHILGYDIKNKKIIIEKLHESKKKNNDITYEIIENIKKIYGIKIPISELIKKSKDESITKRSITTWMVQNGYAKDYIEAGYLYTSKYSPCYVKKFSFTIEEVINMINLSGGIPVLAHPSSLKISKEKLIFLIKQLKEFGLLGIEVNNLDKTTNDELLYYKEIANQLNLIQTCGSDFHDESVTRNIGLDDDCCNNFVRMLKGR